MTEKFLTSAQRLASARKRADAMLGEFAFTRLVESEAVEVWRCKKPNTGMYSHDISITTRGIAVMGDMDGLLFNVGSNYGMAFLAGDDVAYYMHSKLEAQCKEREFNRDGFLAFVAQEVLYKTQDQLERLPALRALVPDGDGGPLAHALSVLYMDRHLVHGEAQQLELSRAIATIADLDRKKGGGVFERYASDVMTFFAAAHAAADTDSIEEAQVFLRENEGTWVDLSDFEGNVLERVHGELLFRLCMVNGSAKRIMAIKDQERVRLGDTGPEVQGFERELLKGDGRLGGGDVLALYDLPETPPECFAAGWNRSTELNSVCAAVNAQQVDSEAAPAEVPRSCVERP